MELQKPGQRIGSPQFYKTLNIGVLKALTDESRPLGIRELSTHLHLADRFTVSSIRRLMDHRLICKNAYRLTADGRAMHHASALDSEQALIVNALLRGGLTLGDLIRVTKTDEKHLKLVLSEMAAKELVYKAPYHTTEKGREALRLVHATDDHYDIGAIILIGIKRKGARNVEQLAEMAGRSPRAVKDGLRKLVALGYVGSRRRGPEAKSSFTFDVTREGNAFYDRYMKERSKNFESGTRPYKIYLRNRPKVWARQLAATEVTRLESIAKGLSLNPNPAFNRDQRARQRRAMIILLSSQHTEAEKISVKTGLSPSKVRLTISSFNEVGMEIFQEGYAPRKPKVKVRRMTPEELSFVKELAGQYDSVIQNGGQQSGHEFKRMRRAKFILMSRKGALGTKIAEMFDVNLNLVYGAINGFNATGLNIFRNAHSHNAKILLRGVPDASSADATTEFKQDIIPPRTA